MSTTTYNGYQGSVNYEDGILRIRILHIDDFITTECNTAADVEATFRDMVDDYIETCREVGRSPSKPFKGSFNVRMSPALHKRIAATAAASGESLNSWVVFAIEEKLARDNTKSALSRDIANEIANLVDKGITEKWRESSYSGQTHKVRSSYISFMGTVHGPTQRSWEQIGTARAIGRSPKNADFQLKRK